MSTKLDTSNGHPRVPQTIYAGIIGGLPSTHCRYQALQCFSLETDRMHTPKNREKAESNSKPSSDLSRWIINK